MYYEWKKRHYGELETVDNLFFIRINLSLVARVQPIAKQNYCKINSYKIEKW